jgi:hypothetical protein
MGNIFLALEGVITGLIITYIFEFILKHNRKLRDRYYRHHEILFGFHLHHSLYGLLAIFVSIYLFFSNNISPAIFVSSMGIGIIALHTITSKRFVFIERQRF